MSRRSGQNGYIEQKGNAYYVRFWMDVSGQGKRKHMSVRLCPVSGPGKMTKPERERKARDIIADSGADTEEHLQQVEARNLGITFRQQAEWWLDHIQTRKRKPTKPATVSGYRSYLRRWLNPNLGDLPLSSVNNLALKKLVANMAEAGMSAKMVNNVVQMVKMVVASAVNNQGEELYPRKWNHEFMDLPEIKNQRTPTFTAEEITRIVLAAGGQYRLLYALLAGAGLRIGEALGLEVEDISPDASTIRIRHSLWNGVVQSPKTPNALREIDLYSSLSAVLKQHIGDRKSGFLFQSRDDRPLVSQSSILKNSLHPILKAMGREKAGFHSFRRFRVTHLRKNHVPDDLLRFWIGHADKSVTDVYSKMKEDVAFRKVCAENVGLGFELPDVVPNVPSTQSTSLIQSVA